MTKILNIKKLSDEVERSPLTKLQLAEKSAISRVTLDNVLKGEEIGLHKFLKLLNSLDQKVGYYFDEENIEIREAGRDYVEKGKIEHKGTEYNWPVSLCNQTDLEKENADLKQKLIEAQQEIITLMKEKRS